MKTLEDRLAQREARKSVEVGENIDPGTVSDENADKVAEINGLSPVDVVRGDGIVGDQKEPVVTGKGRGKRGATASASETGGAQTWGGGKGKKPADAE